MKVWEVVNYYSESPDGLEARDVEGRYLEVEAAEAKLSALAVVFGFEIEEGEVHFEHQIKRMFENYYCIEGHETDD